MAWNAVQLGRQLRGEEDGSRSAVLDDVAHLVRVQPRVDGDEDAARERDPEMRDEERLRIHRQEGDPIALVEAVLAQRRREPAGAGAHFLPGEAQLAVGDGEAIGVGLAGALEEMDRGQFLAVNRDIGHGDAPGRSDSNADALVLSNSAAGRAPVRLAALRGRAALVRRRPASRGRAGLALRLLADPCPRPPGGAHLAGLALARILELTSVLSLGAGAGLAVRLVGTAAGGDALAPGLRSRPRGLLARSALTFTRPAGRPSGRRDGLVELLADAAGGPLRIAIASVVALLDHLAPPSGRSFAQSAEKMNPCDLASSGGGRNACCGGPPRARTSGRSRE